MSQTAITFVVDANVQPAQQKLGAAQKAFEDAAGGADKLAAALRGMQMAQAAADASRFNVAIGTASKGTGQMGRAALEASRAIEDLQYGFAGVVNNIPTLVMGLGMGAGVAGALSLVAIGANQAIKAFGNMPDATSAAATAAKSHMEAVSEAIADANKEIEKLLVGSARGRISAQQAAVEEARVAVERSRAAFRDQFGINPLDQRTMGRIASLAQQGMDTTIERWNAQKGAMERVRVAARDVMEAYRQTTAAYSIAVDEQVLLSKYRAIEDERIAQQRVDAEVDAANAITKAEEDAAKKRVDLAKEAGEDRLRLIYDLHVAMIDEEEKALREIRKARRDDEERQRRDAARALAAAFKEEDKARLEAQRAEETQRRARERAEELHLSRLEQLQGETLAARMAYDTAATEHSMANLDRLKQHEWANLKDTVAVYREVYNDVGRVVEASTAQAISLAQDYIDMRIEGAEGAEEKVAQAFLRGVGQQLVGVGTKYLFEGAGMTILGDPRGPLLAGLGGAAVVAGGAMGAGATAWAHQSAGGTVGRALPERDTRSATDRGAAPGGMRGGGGGGNFVLNLSFGAGGPAPEDIAREIRKVMRSGDARGVA